MKITPVAGPIAASSNAPSTAAQDARARAMSKLMPPPTAQPDAQTPPTPRQNTTSEVETTQVAAPVTEENVTQTAAVEEPQVSARFAALAKREKQARAQALKQEQAIKDREAALQAKEAELTAKLQQYEQSYIPKERLKADPFGTLAEQGVSYDDITQQLLNSQTPIDPRIQGHIQKLESRLADFEAKAKAQEEAQTNSQKTQYEAAKRQITNDVRALVTTDPNFETIKETGSISDVVELIERTFNEEGTLLSTEEAAQLVEDHLIEEAMKLTKIGKIQKKLQPVAPAPAAPEQQQASTQPAAKQPVKTLTNSISSTRQLTAKERAILAFKGENRS